MSDRAFKFDYEREAELLSAENATLRADAALLGAEMITGAIQEHVLALQAELATLRAELAAWKQALGGNRSVGASIRAAIDAAKEQR